MVFVNIDDFIKRHLRYKQNWNTKVTLDRAKWQPLSEDTWLSGCCYAKDSQFKVFETTNFGWVVFHKDTKTPDGNVPGRRIIKW